MEHMNWQEDGHQVNPMAQHPARMHSEARGYLFEFTLCNSEQQATPPNHSDVETVTDAWKELLYLPSTSFAPTQRETISTINCEIPFYVQISVCSKSETSSYKSMGSITGLSQYRSQAIWSGGSLLELMSS